MNQEREELVLTVSEVAVILRLELQDVTKLLDSGELRAFRLNDEWRVLAVDLTEFLKGKIRDSQLRVLSRKLSDPKTWIAQLDSVPDLKRQLEEDEFEEGSFGRWIQNAMVHCDAAESPMLTLHRGSGATDYEIAGRDIPQENLDRVLLRVRRALRARGQESAARIAESTRFRLAPGINHFDDRFQILYTVVSLSGYELLRDKINNADVQDAYGMIADAANEFGAYCIRFVAARLDESENETWDVFLCHASEDKENIVFPVVQYLEQCGVRCWHDEGEIRWGDSISEKINEGLKKSRFVMVVLSPSFLKKPWARKELHAALSKEIKSERTTVLPLLVGDATERESSIESLPIIQDKKYLVWNGQPELVSAELQELIKREGI